MCCFSRPVRHVARTRIFARTLPDSGQQLLAYSMSVEVPEELAMILPLPVALPAAEDAVQFVDLSAYPDFFDDLEHAFPAEFQAAGLSRAISAAPAARALKVHDVGDFEASFVPQQADFRRLDPRFVIDPSIWRQLPELDDWGFAVFKLKPRLRRSGNSELTIHPMVFKFPSRKPEALFFPTLHDGQLRRSARFDHQLYCQPSLLIGHTMGWTPSADALGRHLRTESCADIIEPTHRAYRTTLVGEQENRDVWVEPPAGLSLDDLETHEELFRLRLHTKAAYVPFASGPHLRWQHAARNLGRIAGELRSQLSQLLTARRDAWRLAPLRPDLPHYFINGNQLWSGFDHMTGKPAPAGGQGRVRHKVWSDRIEAQELELAFSELPDGARVRDMQRELNGLIDRVVATLD